MAHDTSKNPSSEDPIQKADLGDEEFPGITWFKSELFEPSETPEDIPVPSKTPASSLLEPGGELPFLQRDNMFVSGEAEAWALQDAEEEDVDEEVDTDSPEMAQARKLMKALVKAIKGTRMYPLDNPICRRFSNELCDLFDDTFGMMTHARFTIGKSKIFFRGEPVIEQPGQDSVPARLFWDGIREVTFRKGLLRQEVLDFLELFRRDHMDGDEGEDDLVTLFWAQHFEHITYMAVDDLLDWDNANDPVPKEFGSAFINFVDIEMHNLEDEEEAVLEGTNEIASEIQKAMNSDDDSELFGVSREDRDAILREFAFEDSPKILGDILVIISETMFLDREEQSFCETVGVVTGALAGLVQDGRLSVAAGLVRLLTELQEEKQDLTPMMQEALIQGLKSGWEGASLQALVEHLNFNLPTMLEGLEDFLDLLPDGATASLCAVLGDITHPVARKRVVEALGRKAKSGLEDFKPYLEDSRPEVLQDMIQILGETQNDRVIPHLKKLISHADDGVRSAALRALARLGPAKAGDVLIRALRDPNSKVRLAAVVGLGGAGRVALPMLVGIIEGKEFAERDLKEKKAFFKALGECGGDEVIPILRIILDQKSLFKRAAQEEMKACACEALGWIGGRFAQKLLEEQAKKKSTMIRSAATSALRRIGSLGDDDMRRSA